MEKNNLPESWEFVSLSTIAKFNPTKPSKSELPDDTLVSFIPMKSVEELSGKINLEQTRKCGDVRRGYTYFQNDDILFAKITPCMENGKITMAYGLKHNAGFGSTEFHVIRLKEKINPKFYFHYLIQDDFRNKAQHKMGGTAGQVRVSSSYMKDTMVPLPPLYEQKRIVEKIEELFTKLNKNLKLLKNILELTKKYEQSIIKYAMQGDLTQKSKHKKYDQKFKSKINFKILPTLNTSYLEKTPEIWDIELLGNISTMFVPIRDKPKQFGGTIPWLRIEDLDGKYASQSKSNQNVTEKTVKEMDLRIYPKGSVICSCSATIGICAITKNELLTNQTFIGIFPNKILDKEFLYYFLLSQTNNFYKIGTGTTILYISRKKFESFPIPMPSLNEQKQIVEKIEENICILKNVEKIILEDIKRNIVLRNSILKSAFEGKLVTQDPNDEPASELLKRIKEQSIN